MARNEPSPDGNPHLPGEPELIADHALRVVNFIAKALVVAESKRIRTKPLKHFWLEPDERKHVLAVPGISQFLKAMLQSETEPESFTVASVAAMTLAVVDEALEQSEPQTQFELTTVARYLEGRLDEAIFGRFLPQILRG